MRLQLSWQSSGLLSRESRVRAPPDALLAPLAQLDQSVSLRTRRLGVRTPQGALESQYWEYKWKTQKSCSTVFRQVYFHHRPLRKQQILKLLSSFQNLKSMNKVQKMMIQRWLELRPDGGTGRHGGLKIRCRKACGFESRSGHQRLISCASGGTGRRARLRIWCP